MPRAAAVCSLLYLVYIISISQTHMTERGTASPYNPPIQLASLSQATLRKGIVARFPAPHHLPPNMARKRSREDSLSSSELPPTPYSRSQSVEVKMVQLDTDTALRDHPAVMTCSLPPHGPLSFTSFEDYDVHYQKSHMNRCSDCQRNFPDQHFLGLHIAENHDPINAAKRDRGEKTVGALFPSCGYAIIPG